MIREDDDLLAVFRHALVEFVLLVICIALFVALCAVASE